MQIKVLDGECHHIEWNDRTPWKGIGLIIHENVYKICDVFWYFGINQMK